MGILKKFKNALLVLSAITLVFGYLTPAASAATTDTPERSNILLSGQEAEDYIKLANESAVYKENGFWCKNFKISAGNLPNLDKLILVL